MKKTLIVVGCFLASALLLFALPLRGYAQESPAVDTAELSERPWWKDWLGVQFAVAPSFTFLQMEDKSPLLAKENAFPIVGL